MTQSVDIAAVQPDAAAEAAPQEVKKDGRAPRRGRWKALVVNVCRMLLAATLLFSGWVKANDPLGVVIKLEEYVQALGLTSPDGLVMLGGSIAMALFEFTLGLALLLRLNHRLTAILTLLFMLAMTVVTAWLYATDAVSDCGCFGDVIILSNGATLLKNIVLLAAAIVVMHWHHLQVRFISTNYSWLVSRPAMVGIVAYAVWSLYALPPVDFRPFYVGADLRAAYEGAEARLHNNVDVRIIYTKDGKTLELGLDDDDPDSTWTYVETRRIPRPEAALRNATFLSHRADAAGLEVLDPAADADVTPDILYADVPVLLLIIPDMRTADQGCAGSVNLIYEWAREQGYGFYCLTASDAAAFDDWTDMTGAEYPRFTADRQLLQTMLRANPGLMLLQDGRVVAKWSNWNLPEPEDIPSALRKAP